ncbi:NADPH-dependent FMN reductase [Neobacillus sp. SuZ13]|uniref:NADPH-dependent FMN reductase n=1 Tax=Neobacillus sp. SuZ13 TaxID=3047875 RepID=UPI0024C0B6AD|nr:NADPH-dependent FMN reductase [Neobacillus sp. SuZ13]WHY69027.1 NADPH-dependent FMN reductase [Neobacillus sp. SuZ13]
MSKITIISGSPSEQTRLNGVLAEVVKQLEGVNIIPEIIHVRNLPAQDLIQAKFNSEEIVRANKKVEDSTIIVILTPVYKASFTGVLKTYLDLLPQNSLEGKTVLPIAIGGTFGHLLMIDYALKPVLAALGATHILKGAFILDSQIKKIENNQYEIDEEAENRIDTSLNFLKNALSPEKNMTRSIV